MTLKWTREVERSWKRMDKACRAWIRSIRYSRTQMYADMLKEVVDDCDIVGELSKSKFALDFLRQRAA